MTNKDLYLEATKEGIITLWFDIDISLIKDKKLKSQVMEFRAWNDKDKYNKFDAIVNYHLLKQKCYSFSTKEINNDN